MTTKFYPYILLFLTCLSWLFYVADGQAEEVATNRQVASDARTKSDAQAISAEPVWRDPFYSGPFGVRTWTDVTGEHRVEGRFVELLPGKVVRLQRLDGRFLQIQLDQLSRADRELVREMNPK